MSSRAVLSLVALFCLPFVGCGRSAEERQLDAMRREIDNVRQTADGDAPAPNLANQTDDSLVVPPAYAPVTHVGPPPPPVVQIGGEAQGASDEGAEADPQDTTPRPTIRVFGSARGSGRSGWHGEDQIEQTLPDEGASATSPAPRATPLDPEAKRAYDAAYSLVSARRFDQALDALASFLVKWPDHPYANNAMYWRGECYFARGDYLRASEQFDGVLKRYPAGNKAPDALLKLGMSQQKLGNAAKANECFDRLVQQFPGSEAARHLPAARASSANASSAAPEDHR